MEVLDINIKIPSIIFPTIVMAMVSLMMKFLKCLTVKENVDIGLLRPSTLTLVIVDFIIVVTMVDVNKFLKRPATPLHAIVDFIIVVIKVVMMV